MMPGSILNIATYPFIPPTSFSGFLRRLGMISAGKNIPETKINKENPPTYLLPHRYVSLGAYPSIGSWSGIHRTYRKGMKEFGHDAFSRLFLDGNKANFQLHTWEYLIAEEFIGYVASESAESLQHIRDLETYGCYIGKEGYAFVSEVSEVLELKEKEAEAYPSVLVPADTLLQSGQAFSGFDIYNLHRYQWLEEAYVQTDQAGLLGDQPTPVDGFIPFVGAYFPSHQGQAPTLNYYTNGEIYIPKALVSLLRGEVYAER
jgi:hypothetical protein